MKSFIFIAAFCFSIQSQAQVKAAYQKIKQAVTGSAQLSELHYFPEQWEVNLSLGYRLDSLDVNLKSNAGTFLDSNHKIDTLETSLRLGLIDSLYTEIKWDYVVAGNLDYSIPANEPSVKYSGLREPLFSFNYRLVDASAIKLDTKIGYQPFIADSKSADSSHDGNAFAGGQAFVVGLKAIALITDSSQIAVHVILKNNGDATEIDQTTNELTEINAHNLLNVEVSTLTKLTSSLFFGLQLDFINIDAYDRRGSSTVAVGSTAGRVLNLIGKYEINPDHLITLEGGYIMDYKGKTANLDLKAEGYSTALAYTVRF